MNIMNLTKGTVVTLKGSHPKDRDLYIVLSDVEMKKGKVFLYDEMVHTFNTDGSYNGADHFHEPYVLSVEEFNKRVVLTSRAMVNKIMKAFNQSKQVTNFPSLKELNEKIKSFNSYDNMMKNVKKIEELENGPWKEELEEIKEFEDHWYTKGFNAGFMAGQMSIPEVNSDYQESSEPEIPPWVDPLWC